MLCVVCGLSPKKYKCPKCLQPYCSLVCYKEHQKTECASTPPPLAQLCGVFHNQEPTLHEPFSTEDTVPRIKMELLKNSNELNNLLCNKHLRNLLIEIDVASDAWGAMKAAMQEPLFLEFADECLKVVEPQTTDECN